jgi:hypothetical protein
MKYVSLRYELVPQVLKVVAFAIVNDVHRAILIRHRLMPASHVDDRETPAPYADRTVDVHPAIVGPTVRDCVKHCREHRRLYRCRAIVKQNASDTAHRVIKD